MLISRSAKSLHFALRPQVVAKNLGLLLLPAAALLVVPLGVSAASGQWEVALRMAAVAAGLGLLGWGASRIECTAKLQTNEALATTALVFLLTGAAVAWPWSAYGLAPLDALFESVSGVTTTGLSTLPSVEREPWSFLFQRAWLQWIGGLGVVVLAVAMLIHPGPAAKRLGFDEHEVDDLAGGTRAHARRILVVYLVLTLASVLLLLLLGASLADALPHALSAISTGGFSTRDRSLAGLGSPWLSAAVTAITLAGAFPLVRYWPRRGRGRPLLGGTQLALLAFVLVGAVLAFLLRTPGREPWLAAAGDSLVMAASAGTTAGFSSVPVPELPSAVKLVLIVLMTIGGEIGSTAGGLKILRVLVLLGLLRRLLESASVARTTRIPLRVGASRFAPEEAESVVAIVAAYLGVVLLSWLAFLAHGYDPLDSLFEVASATGTVGLSAGLSREALEPALKGVLCLDMLLGRVEIVAMLLLVFPPTWIGRRRPWR